MHWPTDVRSSPIANLPMMRLARAGRVPLYVQLNPQPIGVVTWQFRLWGRSAITGDSRYGARRRRSGDLGFLRQHRNRGQIKSEGLVKGIGICNKPELTAQDMAATLRSMRDLGFGNASNADRAMAALSSFTPRQYDDLGWMLGVAGNTLPTAVDQLLVDWLDHANRGPVGLSRDFGDSPYDLAHMATAAWRRDRLDPTLGAALLTRLAAMQNSDGAFGASPNGVGHAATTAYVIAELAGRTEPLAVTIAGRAAAWLRTQRQADGRFGSETDAVLTTALAVEGLEQLAAGDDVSASLAYLRQHQSQAGDWNGSTFTTAQVLRTLQLNGRANLLFERPLAATPSTPASGDVVHLAARVRLDGSSSQPIAVAFYDGDPDQGGTRIGSELSLGVLGSGRSAEVGIDWPTAGLSGVHHLAASIDPHGVVDESNRTDNLSRLDIDLGSVPTAPDAALLRDLIAADPPTVAVYPTTVHVRGKVRNLGGAPLVAMPLVLYSLRDGQRSERARTVLDIAALADGSFDLAFTLQRDDSAQLLLVADPDNLVAEFRETNNELRIDVGRRDGIDLVVAATDLSVVNPPAAVGRPVTLRATVHNNGNSDTGNFDLVASVTVGGATTSLGTLPAQLAGGASAERQWTYTPTATGTVTLQVQADPAQTVADVDRANNSATLEFTVGAPGSGNLVVDSSSLLLTPAPLDQDHTAHLHGSIRNTGATITTDIVVAVSTGSGTGGRVELARATLAGGLVAGATRDVEIDLPALTDAGDRYFFLTVDPDKLIAESDDSDNTGFTRVHVRSRPDAALSVASIQLTPSVPQLGATAQVTVTVRNLGEQPIDNLAMALYEGDPAGGAVIPGNPVIAHIDGGGTGVAQWTWTYGLLPGSHRVSALADPADTIRELREDNNLALLDFERPAGDYATEPYFSPNGDGIKDNTTAVFRTLTEAPTTISVLDRGDRVVRHFQPSEISSANGISVTWDGRDDDGLIDIDSRYRIRALSASGRFLGEVSVVLDTNRSSLLEALGTPLLRTTTGVSGNVLLPPRSAPDQDTVIEVGPDNLDTPETNDRLPGIYRFDVLLGVQEPIVDASWLLAHGAHAEIDSVGFVADGRTVVFELFDGSSTSLWKSDVGSRNSPVQIDNSVDRYAQYAELDTDHVIAVSRGARLYDLRSGSHVSLAAPASPATIVDTFADGALLRYDARTSFVSVDPGTAPVVVFDENESATPLMYGERGALVDRRASGLGTIEWRSLRSGERRALVTAAGTANCDLETSVATGSSYLVVSDSARRLAYLVDVDSGVQRTVVLPPLERRGSYATHYHVNTEETGDQSADVISVSSRHGRGCPTAAANRTRVQGAKSDIATAAFAARNAGHVPVLLEVGEEILARSDYQGDVFEKSVVAATDVFRLAPDTGAVTRIGRYSNWPLVDTVEADRYPLISVPPTTHLPVGYELHKAIEQGLVDLDGLLYFEARLLLRDGSGIDRNGQAFDGHGDAIDPLNNGSVTGQLFPGQTHLFGDGVLSTLANQPTRLRARSQADGIRLDGIATDLAFDHLQIEWADVASPSLWNALGPPQTEPMTDGELLTFAPPSPGQYLIRLSTVDRAGNQRAATARALSPVGADISSASATPAFLSPNGDGVNDQLAIDFVALRPLELDLRIRDAQSAVIYSRHQTVSQAGPVHWTWDGRDDGGQVVRDGVYRIEVGSWFSRRIVVDNTLPTVQLSRYPGPDQLFAIDHVEVAFAYTAQDANRIEAVLERADPATPATWVEVSRAPVDPSDKARVSWNADDRGRYRLAVVDAAGNRAIAQLSSLNTLISLGKHDREAGDSDDFAHRSWGCDLTNPEGDPCLWTFESGRYVYVGKDLLPAVAGDRLLLDYWLPAETDVASATLDFVASGVGAAQPMPIVASYREGSRLRLVAIAPSLPQQSTLEVHAKVVTSAGDTLNAESLGFTLGGVRIPVPVVGLDLSDPCAKFAAAVGGRDARTWCVQEFFKGTAATATLRIAAPNSSVVSVTPSIVIDGFLAFTLPEGACDQVAATVLTAQVTDARGRIYISSTTCQAQAQIMVALAPVTVACGESPSEQVRLQAAVTSSAPQQVQRFRARYTDASGQVRNVFDVTNLPAVDPSRCPAASPLDCPGSALHSDLIDTRGLAEGSYPVELTATIAGASDVTVTVPFKVDRSAGDLAIVQPKEGQRLCLLTQAAGPNKSLWHSVIPLQYVAHDAPGVAVTAGVAIGSSSSSPAAVSKPGADWIMFGTDSSTLVAGSCTIVPATDSSGNPIHSTFGGTDSIDINGSRMQSCVPSLEVPRFDAQGNELPKPSGPMNALIGAVNWSGAPVCRRVDFVADSGPDYRIDGVIAAVKTGGRIPVLNPTGPNQFRSLSVALTARELLRLRVDLVRPTSGEPIVVGPVSGLVTVPRGPYTFAWSGALTSGGPLSDGSYALALHFIDDCQFEQVEYLPVVVDTTPPEVQITSPQSGSTVTGPLLVVLGGVTDLHGGRYVLSTDANQGSVIASASFGQVVGNPQLGQWNRGDTSGPVTLSLEATDAVGNVSRLQVPVLLAPRAAHLIDDAKVQPPAFSPNGDGLVDTASVDYVLASNALVTLRALRPDGSLLTPLVNAEPQSSGNHALAWNGAGLPPTGADGLYLLELTAANSNDVTDSESVRLPVRVDRTAPALSLVNPSGDWSNGRGDLTVAIDDPDFVSASWQIDGHQGTVDGAGSKTLLSLADLSEGGKHLVVLATDSVGNTIRFEKDFGLDRSAPTAALTAPADNAVLGGANSRSDLVGTASDAHLQRYQLSLASAATPTAGSVIASGTASVTAGKLGDLDLARPDGDYLLDFGVTDLAGNASSIQQHLAIDHAAPTARIDLPLANAVVGSQLSLRGSADDLHFGSYSVRIATPDQAGNGQWSELYTGHAKVVDGELLRTSLALPDGDYVLSLRVTDAVNLVSEARVRITLDSQPPATPLNLVGHRDGNDVLLDWSPVIAADLAGYWIYRDGARVNSALITGTSFRDAAPPEGRLRYEVTAVDRGGNESPRSIAVLMVVDRTPPTVAITTPVAGERVSGRIEISGTAYSSDDFDRYQLSAAPVGGGSAQVLVQSNQSLSNAVLANFDTVGRAEGSGVRFTLEAWDRNGNRAVVSRDAVIDNQPPAAPTGLTAVLTGDDGQIRWDGNSESDLLGYILLRDGNAVNASAGLPADLRTIALAAHDFLDRVLPDGHHSYVVYAIDQAGNLSLPSAPFLLDVSRRAPEIHLRKPLDQQRFDRSVAIEAESPDTDVAQVLLDMRAVGSNGAWSAIGTPLTQAPYRSTWTPGTLAHGNYQIRARAIDTGNLESTAPAIVTVAYVDLTPPGAPTGLVAHADGGTVHLNWTAPADGDLAGYVVERAYVGLEGESIDWERLFDTPQPATQFDDTGLDDLALRYRIVAIDTDGNESPPSASADAVVFSIRAEPTALPSSPTRDDHAGLSLRSPRAGTLAVVRSVDGGSAVPVASGAIVADAAQSVTGLVLLAGHDRFDATVTDAGGNRSRVASVDITRGTAPSAPTGLALVNDAGRVRANWNANPESNIVGYRLYRRNFAVPPDALTPVSADGVPSYHADYAVDGDPDTAWLSTFGFAQGEISGIHLDLHLGPPHWVSRVHLSWVDGKVPAGYRVEGLENGNPIALARFDGDERADVDVVFDAPYYTDTIRVVPTISGFAGVSIALAEVSVTERPLITATSYLDSVTDGHYEDQVSAVNTLGFEGPRSTAASIDIGDSDPPPAVVLSGTASSSDAVLSWTASVASDLDHYEVRRGSARIAVVPAATTAYRDAGVPNGAYDYTVIAVDTHQNESAPSNSVHLVFSASLPGIPRNLAVTAPVGGGALALSWQAGDGAAPARYLVRRGATSTGPFSQVATVTTTTVTDQPLVNGTTYWYTAEAQDGAGNGSGPTAAVSGIPRDALAPVTPFLGHPVQSGTRIDLDVATTVVAGEAEAGATVTLTRNSVAVGQALARSADATNNLAAIIPSRLHVAPSGSWVWSEAQGNSVVGVDSGDQTSAALDPLTSWTRDDRIIGQDPNSGDWYAFSPASRDRRRLTLPLTTVTAAAFSSDLHYAVAIGSGSGTSFPGLYILDLVAQQARAVISVDPPVGALHGVVFADEAGYAAWRTASGELVRVDLANGAVTRLAQGIDDARIDIERRTGDVLYVRTVGSVRTVQRVGADGVSVNLGDGVAAVFSPSGDRYAVIGADGHLRLCGSSDRSLERQLGLGLSNLVELEWSASDRLIVASTVTAYAIDLVGSFRVTGVALAAGDNRLAARATDASNNTSGASANGTVHRPAATQLDLALANEDLRFLPASGPPGGSYGVQITVRNLGAAAAAATTLHLELVAPDASHVTLPARIAVPAITAGGSATVGVSLGNLGLAGAYQLTAVVDPDNQQVEADEGNNVASARLLLSSSTRPTLDLALDSSAIAPSIELSGRVGLSNSGNRFSGAIRLNVRAADGVVVTDLGSIGVRDLPFGGRIERELRWPSSGAAAGNYSVVAQLLDTDGQVLDSLSAPFQVGVSRDLRLAVSAERTSYLAGDTARITTLVDFAAGNADLAGGQLHLAVSDAGGVIVFSTDRALATLQPGYRIQVPVNWTVAGAVGSYRLHTELVVAGSVLAQADSSLAIDAGNAPSLRGEILPSPDPVIAGRSATLAFALVNPGSSGVHVDSLVLTLLRQGDLSVVGTATLSGDVAAAARLAGSLDLTPLNLALGSYLARLDLRLAGDAASRLLALRSVGVIDAEPPLIDLRLPAADSLVAAPIEIGAAISDRHSGIAKVEIEIDGAGFDVAGQRSDGLYGTALTGLADGPHRYRIRATDRAGNAAISAERSFSVDATPPQIVITGVADGDAVNHPVTPHVEVIDAHPGSTTISLNAAAFTSDTVITADGSYTLQVIARDLAGNTATALRHFLIDRTPPAIAITAPADGSSVDAATVDVTIASEAAAHLHLTAGAYQADATAAADGHATFADVPLLIGPNTLAAYAEDALANRSATATLSVQRRDPGASALSGSLVPASSAIGLGQVADIAWQVLNNSDTPRTAQPLAVRVVRAGSLAPLGLDSFSADLPARQVVNGASHFPTTGATLGHYLATLEVPNGASATVIASAEFDLVDATPPNLTVITPTPGALVGSTLVLATTASDALSGIEHVDYLLDGAAAVLLSLTDAMTHRYQSLPLELTDGSHQVRIRAVDGAGNLTSSALIAFEVDRTAPTISITGVADGAEYAHAVAATINVSDTHPGSSTVRLDGQPYTSGSNITADGSHHLAVDAVDAAGNAANRVIDFRIDTTAPAITIGFPTESAVLAVDHVDVAGQTEAGANVELRVNGGSSVAVAADDHGGFVVPGVALAVGADLIEARASDTLGNTSAWLARHVEYRPNNGVQLAAELTPTPLPLPLGQALHVAYSLHNTGSVPATNLPLRLRLVRSAGQVEVDSKSFSGTLAAGASSSGSLDLASASSAPGAHLLLLEDQLPGSGWQLVASTSVDVVDVDAPTVAILAPADGSVVSASFAVRATAHDSASSLAEVRAETGDGGIVVLSPTATPDEFDGTVTPAHEGSLTIKVRAIDSAGNAAVSAQRGVIVDLAPPQISLAGASEGQLVNHPVTLTISITDASTVTSTITLDSVTFVSGSSVSSDGTHTLLVHAVDALNQTSDASLHFRIDRTAPTIAITAPVNGATVTTATIKVDGQTEAGARVDLTAGAFGAAVTADAAGQFSVDTVPLVVGHNTVSAKATDAAGNVSAAVTIDVVRSAPSQAAVQGLIDFLYDHTSIASPVKVPVHLENTGNVELTGLPVLVRVTAHSTHQLLDEARFSLDLAVGALQSRSVTFQPDPWPLGLVDIELFVTLPAAPTATLLDHRSVELVNDGLFKDGFDIPTLIFRDGLDDPLNQFRVPPRVDYAVRWTPASGVPAPLAPWIPPGTDPGALLARRSPAVQFLAPWMPWTGEDPVSAAAIDISDARLQRRRGQGERA